MSLPDPVPGAFEDALRFTLRWEGGLSDHPADKGGRTAYGITQATYDAWRKGKPPRDVWDIGRDEVNAIYRSRYWNAVNGDAVAAISPRMALCLFDAAVNHGTKTAAQMFQRTVHADPDGIVGKITLSCYRLRRMAYGETQLLTVFLERRKGLYAGIIRRDRRQAVFRNGWRARLNQLCETVGVEPVWDDLPPAA